MTDGKRRGLQRSRDPFRVVVEVDSMEPLSGSPGISGVSHQKPRPLPKQPRGGGPQAAEDESMGQKS